MGMGSFGMGGMGGFMSPGIGRMLVIWAICIFLAILGGILLHFLFLNKKNEGQFQGFLGWLYDFLNFKKMLAEQILRVLYLISASFITLYALGLLLFLEGGAVGDRLLMFLFMLVGGNVIARIMYELVLIVLIICRNTTEINEKLGSKKISDD